MGVAVMLFALLLVVAPLLATWIFCRSFRVYDPAARLFICAFAIWVNFEYWRHPPAPLQATPAGAYRAIGTETHQGLVRY